MDEYVTLDGYEVVFATVKALRIRKDGTSTDLWVPRAHVMDGDTLDKGDTDIVVAKWVADREGLDTD